MRFVRRSWWPSPSNYTEVLIFKNELIYTRISLVGGRDGLFGTLDDIEIENVAPIERPLDWSQCGLASVPPQSEETSGHRYTLNRKL